MAAKEVQKEVKKEVVKKGRRLKRSVRKTLGALFLASSIAVAAIPTEGLQANEAQATRKATSYTVKNDSSEKDLIPTFTKEDTIYTSGNGMFQFALATEGVDKVAVILGFTSQSLGGGAVEIPEEVIPYTKFTNSMGATGGYVAIGYAGNFLYWKETKSVPVMDEEDPSKPKLDASGKPVYKDEFVSYHPCYADEYDRWKDIPADQLYYDKDKPVAVPGEGRTLQNETDALSTSSDSQYRFLKAVVKYIGNQYLEIKKDKDGKEQSGIWQIGDSVTDKNPEKGVFADNGNITTLKISGQLLGIGDYAFYRCGGLSGIELGDGLRLIGKGAFYDCTGMKEIKMATTTNLNTIGEMAFYNCQSLSNFVLPINTVMICDSAFEGCKSLTTLDLLSANQPNALSKLGRDVFKNCEALQSLTFPDGVTGEIYISAFEGCKSLHWISTRNMSITFVEEPDVFSYQKFKNMLSEESGSPVNGAFYFQGMVGSALHNMAKDNCFAYSHIQYIGRVVTDLDRYELTVQETGSDAAGRSTYIVNSSKHLVDYQAGKDVKTVTIPNRIGPHAIQYIDSNTFQNKCNITKVEIPANIISIQSNAFKGCHNLANVLFASENVEIGADAFRTQDNTSHESTCPDNKTVPKGDGNTPAVKLHFTGPVSEKSGPFNYAMSEAGRYNNGEQTPSYITYYTGWPQNMEIQFNSTTGMSELVDFPSLAELSGDKYTKDNYAYITSELQTAASQALDRYKKNLESEMSEYELQIIAAAMKVKIPEGVQSVKNGLFKEKEQADDGTLKEMKTVEAYSLKKITFVQEDSAGGDPGTGTVTGTFAGCKQLSSIKLLGGVESLDSYAFMNCEGLTEVVLPATLKTVGNRPFAGCSKLTAVDFSGGPYFECENCIIYELSDRTRKKVVECLEGRTNPKVSANELKGIEVLYPEAFMGGTKILNVDLSESNVTVIPLKAFMNNASLAEVTLPRFEPKSIQDDAFTDCPNLIALTIPGERAQISPDAFRGSTKSEGKVLWFYCEDKSDAAMYADTYNPYIQWEETKPVRYWIVRFGYLNDKNEYTVIGEPQEILEGEAATPPEDDKVPAKTGQVFTGWAPVDYLAVYKNLDVTAQYGPETETYYDVIFLNEDGSTYYTQRVQKGKDAIPIQPPYKKGSIFVGWRIIGGDGSTTTTLTNIQSDVRVIAVYRTAGEGEDDGSGTQTQSPSPGPGSDNPNASGSPNPDNPNASGSPDPSGSSSPGTSGKFYTLTVQNGSGSGSYLEGSQPVIIANDPASGQVFDYWSVSPADVKIASTVLSASIITMPASDVTVTAHYKVGSGGSGYTGSGNNSQRPNGSVNSVTKNGTTVVIDKNGLSNTGVVSATVNGSSDNFTIKITDTAEATEAALRALMNEYGNLDNIKYFPMDISLYDSTGTNKITDTTGLSVSITLPLPDSLITYAGNNKVASTLNDRLEKLSARFTTIQGVSCITFTAEHFSPYVIYVDTGDLSSGLVSDSTPKTGDFIHPKWFLSIGLACLSFVFFIQKDAKRQKKVKVKVRA